MGHALDLAIVLGESMYWDVTTGNSVKSVYSNYLLNPKSHLIGLWSCRKHSLEVLRKPVGSGLSGLTTRRGLAVPKRRNQQVTCWGLQGGLGLDVGTVMAGYGSEFAEEGVGADSCLR